MTGLALCEVAWVLQRRYSYDRIRLTEALRLIVEAELIALDRPAEIHRALARFETGPADFADYLIGEISFAAGCDDVVTFDRKLRDADGFTLLG